MNPAAPDFQTRLAQRDARQNRAMIAISACVLVAGLYWLYAEQRLEPVARLYVSGFRLSWLLTGFAALILVGSIVVAIKARKGPAAWLTDAGVHGRDTFLPWDDIDTVHTYVVIFNGAPIHHLRATAADGRVVKFEYAAFGADTEAAFDELRGTVLERVGARQWDSLTERLGAGQPYEFIPGLAVYEHGVQLGGDIVPWSRIRRYEIEKGLISLVVEDGGKTTSRRIGTVAQTANLHLFLHLLDQRIAPG